ncbi:MAG: transglycosylase SLT domain-containing protein [Candidatus Nanopelagicales bacterium]
MTSSRTRATVAGAISIPLILGTVAVPATASAPTTAAVKATSVAAKKDRTNRPPSRGKAPYRFGTVNYNKWYAKNYMQYRYGWGKKHRKSLVKLWTRESGWSQHAHNGSSGAHGIPQALPGSKMASHGRDWRKNPETQIKWGLSYIKGRYGTPHRAWKAFQRKGWY